MDPVMILNKQNGGSDDSPARPVEMANLATKLSEAREQLSTNIGNIRMESYSKFCELSTEIGELTKSLDLLAAEFEKAKWKVKFGALVLSVCIAGMAYLGFQYGYRDFYRDMKDTVTQRLETEIRRSVISKDRTFYNDLVAGNALDAAGQYGRATERLLGCFKEGHYYDSAVLVPLLDSIYKNYDWESATMVLDVLEKGDPQLIGINDHTILAYIGSIEVQAGEVHQDWPERGFTLLQRAQLLTPPGDSATLSLIHSNYWIYDLRLQDWKSAEAEISALKQLGVSVDEWDAVRRGRFFTGYFAQSGNLAFEPRIRTMWSQLPHTVSEQ